MGMVEKQVSFSFGSAVMYFSIVPAHAHFFTGLFGLFLMQ